VDAPRVECHDPPVQVLVCGGSVIGLASALLLARDGHTVTVLESDEQDAPPPRTAWDGWERKGVAQFRQPHNLFPRFQQILDLELPQVTERLLDAGCVWENDPFRLPAHLDQARQPGDERFRFLTGRRPAVEAAFADAARDADGLTVRRGVRVLDHLLEGSRVVGVRTTEGEVRADLVIDAMGRQSPTVDLLAAQGHAPQVESQDRGFTYYTRYFRGPERPQPRGPNLMPIGSFSLLTIAGDNDTWSATVFITSDDKPLKALRAVDAWTRVVSACPLQRHWLDGEPITDVLPMAGIMDRYRRFVVDGRPVVTGLLAVGDAWACTNPSAGRGLSVGLVHAQQLQRVVAQHDDGDLEALAHAWDAATEEHVTPFFRNQVRADTIRVAEMRAHQHGEPPPVDEERALLVSAAMKDADVFRSLMDMVYCLAFPEQVLARPGIAEKVKDLGTTDPPPLMGPDRAELLALVSQ
jgi:2-polyprenyl-6-methoxyphenol hydroxylase-like FAD-dependent oxidoreductase